MAGKGEMGEERMEGEQYRTAGKALLVPPFLPSSWHRLINNNIKKILYPPVGWTEADKRPGWAAKVHFIFAAIVRSTMVANVNDSFSVTL